MLTDTALRARKQRRRRRKPIDGRTKTAKRIRELTAGYLAALGDVASAEAPERCERVAQLVALAEDVRRKALTGRSVSLDDVIRVENTADRARRALGLPNNNGKCAEIDPGKAFDALRSYLATKVSA